jgi:hypothetical protein
MIIYIFPINQERHYLVLKFKEEIKVYPPLDKGTVKFTHLFFHTMLANIWMSFHDHMQYAVEYCLMLKDLTSKIPWSLSPNK